MSDATSEREADSLPRDGLYRVLARKYRPSTFADLVGQEALVRTLTNAIDSGRLAHGFILTGVRGVGKTTTARIIARALNCVGPDGAGGPTPSPCGVCAQCTAIAQDRHVDVIEMDAASRTGVGDIRELIEGVRYRPVQARYKIYIIDEVHMLSNQAFNALLKTLEEPPEHVVFIFATTEIRKVPVTVLSRCQRFDLRRLTTEDLQGLFGRIVAKEGVSVAPEALAMIARAADGSARDGLSLLDQAIALGGGTTVEAAQVQAMLGLADRARIFDLFEALVGGKVPESLDIVADLYAAGADPAVMVQDLLELAHFLTRAKLVPQSLESPGLPETERLRGRVLSEKLSLAALARIWQMLLKGLGEVQAAPVPLQAAEMALIRLAYVSDLPTPTELVERLSGVPGGASGSAGGARSTTAQAGAQA
ncbi:MAG TPA: DNA polymerase III subunit gamma/tau, partial [Kiloniellaceae bacterium]